MKVVVNGLAWLPKSELSPPQLKALREELTVMPRSIGDYPGEEKKPIHLYSETQAHIGIARGYFETNRRDVHDVVWDLVDGANNPQPALVFNGSLRPEQGQAIREVGARLKSGKLGGVIRATAGWGKCCGLGTPILRKDGSILPIEDIVAGDTLMGPDSQGRTVLSTTRGSGELYRITPVVGEPWVCNDVHVLTLVHSVSGEVIDIELGDYLALPAWKKRDLKQFAPERGVDFSEGPQLPIDPYFLGVWYGDGTKALNGVAVTTMDAEIVAMCEDVAAAHGLQVRKEDYGWRCPTYHLTRTVASGGNSLLSLMREVCGDASCIPRVYLTSSRENRQQLLAGLIDSDGHNNNGCIRIVQRRRQYAEDIAFLARSLGLRATLRPKVVNGTTYWRVNMAGDFGDLPIRLARKYPGERKQKKIATRTGFSVEAIGYGEYAGFTLDGDGRFLLGDFTVTHNTVAACSLMADLGVPTLVIVHKEFLMTQWKERISQFLPDAKVGRIQQDTCDVQGNHIVLGMVQSLSCKEYPSWVYDYFGMVIVDEVHRIGAFSWAPVPQKFRARWRVGFSATPKRKDGADNVLNYHLGPLLFSAKEQRMVPKVKRVWTGFKLVQTSSFNPNLAKKGMVLRFLCGSVRRNRQIVEQLIGALQAGRKVIVLSERLQHLSAMEGLLREMWPSDAGVVPSVGYYVGGKTKAQLAEASTARVIFATTQFASEGLDVPALDTLILTTPMSDVEQAVGRILRPFDGKKEPIVVDIRDDDVAVCKRAAKGRDRYYDSL